MPRIPALTDRQATPSARELMERVEQSEGMVTNVIRTVAHSPAALKAVLEANGSLAEGMLDEKLRYRIALVVSETNRSPYCLASYVAFSRASGLSESEIDDARRGSSPESRIDAVLKFARKIVLERSAVVDGDLDLIRRAGYSDPEIIEIVSIIALTIHINYLNNVAGTEVDFTPVPPLHET